MEIWPAIDIRGGQCVRLYQGDYDKETVYGSSPAAMAEHWASLGAKSLHLVDLDGAKEGKRVNFDAIKEIVERVEIPCELGGGIRNEEGIETYLGIGVHRLVIGTLALKEKDWFRRWRKNIRIASSSVSTPGTEWSPSTAGWRRARRRRSNW